MIKAANELITSPKPAPAERKRRALPSNHHALNELSSDAHHLHQLLDVVTTKLCEIDFDAKPGQRPSQLGQITALAWIARDLAQRLENGLEAAINAPTEAELAEFARTRDRLQQGSATAA